MLAPAVVVEIQRLLAEHQLSQRAIARQLGVSRGIIQLVAQGKRRVQAARPEQPSLASRRSGPLQRCPGCGGRVHLPCLVCRLRAAARAQPRLSPMPEASQGFSLVSPLGLSNMK